MSVRLRIQRKSKREAARDNSTKKTITPAAAVLIEQYEIDPKELTGTGKDGAITKADVVRYLETRSEEEE